MKRFALLVILVAATAALTFRPSAASADTASNVQFYLNDSTGAATGFSFRQINGPVIAAKNTTTVFEPASTIKALHHLHAVLRVQQGAATWAESITSSTQYNGSCPLWPANLTVTESLQTALTKMMWNSDNARTDAIRRRFGQQAINGTAQSLGMSQTLLQHRIGCGGEAVNAHNMLTLKDAATLYEKALIGNLLTQASKDKFRVLMPNQLDELNDVIAQEAFFTYQMAVPAEFAGKVKVSFKAGGYSLSENGSTKHYRSIAGYLELPFKMDSIYGPVVIPRRYTFGLFIDRATSEADADHAFTNAITELLRLETRKALGTFK